MSVKASMKKAHIVPCSESVGIIIKAGVWLRATKLSQSCLPFLCYLLRCSQGHRTNIYFWESSCTVRSK